MEAQVWTEEAATLGDAHNPRFEMRTTYEMSDKYFKDEVIPEKDRQIIIYYITAHTKNESLQLSLQNCKQLP
ncbi:hypothetical protein ACSVDA_09640 [Cytobacillus sp. Hm23]